MEKNWSLIILGLLLFVTTKSQSQKRITVDSTALVIDGSLPPYNTLQAGDSLVLSEGIRPFLLFKNIIGSVDQPIVIINEEGTVEINSNHYYGISIRQSRYIKLSGNGDKNFMYGIQIFNRQGSGLSIGDFSSNVEVEHVEVGFSQYAGITDKTEPFCGFDRTSFLQENSHIHHCYVHDTGNEGMYIGSTFYQGQTIQCNGVPSIVFPPLLRNVNIHHNIIENTGWDGIQVASATQTKIHHNSILHDSQQMIDWQMTGITLGEGSDGEIYNNKVTDGEGMGIYTKGLGDVRIYNNQIIRPGYKNNLPSGKYGIYIEGMASLNGKYFHVLNNLIINPKFEGIRFLHAKEADKNTILNNVIVQETYLIEKDNVAFINTMSQQVCVKNNFTTTEMSTARFKNNLQDDYSVEEGSILIDGGSNLGIQEINCDFTDQPREKGYGIDIGPFESPYFRNNSHDHSSAEMAIPNPISISSKTNIYFNNPDEGWIEFVLVSPLGGEIKIIDKAYFEEGLQVKSIEGITMQPGLNFLVIRKRMTSSLIRISIFRD